MCILFLFFFLAVIIIGGAVVEYLSLKEFYAVLHSFEGERQMNLLAKYTVAVRVGFKDEISKDWKKDLVRMVGELNIVEENELSMIVEIFPSMRNILADKLGSHFVVDPVLFYNYDRS